jgi:hypothetical protein
MKRNDLAFVATDVQSGNSPLKKPASGTKCLKLDS